MLFSFALVLFSYLIKNFPYLLPNDRTFCLHDQFIVVRKSVCETAERRGNGEIHTEKNRFRRL